MAIWAVTLVVGVRHHPIVIMSQGNCLLGSGTLLCVFNGIGVRQTQKGCRPPAQNRWENGNWCQAPASPGDVAVLFFSFPGSVLIWGYKGRRVQWGDFTIFP